MKKRQSRVLATGLVGLALSAGTLGALAPQAQAGPTTTTAPSGIIQTATKAPTTSAGIPTGDPTDVMEDTPSGNITSTVTTTTTPTSPAPMAQQTPAQQAPAPAEAQAEPLAVTGSGMQNVTGVMVALGGLMLMAAAGVGVALIRRER